MSGVRGKVRAATAAALTALLCLTGCSFDLGQIVTDKIAEEVGEGIVVSLGAGPTCMPEWVNFPDTDSANQGMKVPEGELCVSSWFLDESDGFDANQSLPEMLDDYDLEELAVSIIPLLFSQLPGPVREAVADSNSIDDVNEALKVFDEVLVFKAYGEGQRVLLLLVADGGTVADYQLVIGAFYEGNC